MRKLAMTMLTLAIWLVLCSGMVSAAGGPATSTSTVTVNNISAFTDAGTDARGISPGTFGSQYGRMLRLTNGDWLAAYTIYDNNGYTRDANGGTRLRVSKSTNNGATWTVVSNISDPGRDLDNAQMVQMPNGDVLLAARSVRWQESYKLYVYKSTNLGANWSYLSTIDQNNGTPGSLGNPDKGVYEPHMGFLADGRLAVFYANEKHVTESPSYSQIISEKISSDGGATWGSEIYAAWDPSNSSARPGMPVWTKMANGKYILALEVCGTQGCNIFSKTSNDGYTWSSGIGTQVPDQLGAPYVLSMSDGRLAIVSNVNTLSFSNDYGTTWYKNDTFPWASSLWASVYQTGPNEIAIMNSASRAGGGNNIQLAFMNVKSTFSYDFNDGNDAGWSKYGGTWTVSGGAYTVSSSSGDKSIVDPYVSLVNYSVEADVKLNNAGQASIIFSAASPSAGADNFIGYAAGIDSGGSVWLGKFNNNFTSLGSASATISTGTNYKLKIVKTNGRIQVFRDGVLKLDQTDTSYSKGTIGLRGGFGNSATFDNVVVTPFLYANDFSSATNPGWTNYEGTWSFSGGTYNMTSGSAPKSILSPLVNNESYTLQADVRINGTGQGSLLWNVQNPGNGADTFKGYGAGIDTGGTVLLGRFNNSYTQLGSASNTIASNVWYNLKVVITGNRMQVYVNNALKIDVSDSTYKNGAIGVRGGFSNNVSFDNLIAY
ncbi:DUF1080 domain-containing protein [Cohnella endophytica]|uniref:DUF1080 domain-containing protein n=1 Tax=Cohnella endophytica TaxID=2419778 RepID=A0A494XZF0_9BACL|nr:family 16 glycoside hydrolase [Cohnella endophytica]RKP52923.1 DUF1080 domain-containing protein [Cohnella endophytica]